MTSYNIIFPKQFPLRSQWAVDRARGSHQFLRGLYNERIAFGTSFMGQLASHFPCLVLTEVATPSELSMNV